MIIFKYRFSAIFLQSKIKFCVIKEGQNFNVPLCPNFSNCDFIKRLFYPEVLGEIEVYLYRIQIFFDWRIRLLRTEPILDQAVKDKSSSGSGHQVSDPVPDQNVKSRSIFGSRCQGPIQFWIRPSRTNPVPDQAVKGQIQFRIMSSRADPVLDQAVTDRSSSGSSH
jgi:hypothetical protein